MSPSRRQIKPERVIAVFGKKDDPLFAVERGEIPGQETPEDKELFIIRDADQGLPSTMIAAGELDHIDPKTGTAKLELEIDRQSGEEIYHLLPGDIVGAIGAVAKDSRVTEVRLGEVNLPANILDRIVGPAELVSGNPDSEPFEFRIAA